MFGMNSPLAPLLQRGDYIKLILLLMFVSGLSCAADDFKTVDAAVPFAGAWLSEDYYNSIKKFRSPRKAQGGSEYIKYIVIPNRTLVEGARGNFHEGIGFGVFKNGEKYQTGSVSNNGLSDIEVISPTKLQIEGKSFVKINPVMKKRRGIELILEEILFKGEYKDKDGKTIQFKRDGQVIGLEGFHYYAPLLDYADAGLNIDMVILGKTEKDLETPPANFSKWFGFKFNKNNFELYKVKCLTYYENECVKVDFGQLVYKLRKIS